MLCLCTVRHPLLKQLVGAFTNIVPSSLIRQKRKVRRESSTNAKTNGKGTELTLAKRIWRKVFGRVGYLLAKEPWP